MILLTLQNNKVVFHLKSRVLGSKGNAPLALILKRTFYGQNMPESKEPDFVSTVNHSKQEYSLILTLHDVFKACLPR